MAKRERIIQVRMTPKEFAMAEALAGSFGDVSMPDVMRQCLRQQFGKTFPVYARKGENAGAGTPKDELTQEQIVEMLEGRVVRHEGNVMGEWTLGTGRISRIPLNMIGFGEFTLEKLKLKYGKK